MSMRFQLASFGCILLCLGGAPPARAQQRQLAVPASVHTVALAPDTCPLVHLGDIITLDWNPGYAPAWPVVSLDAMALYMKRQAWVTAGTLDTPLVLFTPLPLHPFPRLANGFFHIEMKIAQRRPSGDYFVFRADDRPSLVPQYTAPRPAMTHSPANARLCVRFEDTGVLPPAPQP